MHDVVKLFYTNVDKILGFLCYVKTIISPDEDII